MLFLLPGAALAADGYAFSPQWLALVHYRPAWGGGYRSSIDSDNFFISPHGKTDPAAELAATVDLFEKGEDRKTICRFPARYKLLRRQGLVKRKIPLCQEFAQFKKDLRPAGVTLLFTDAYMNNPSSLFGHTLLRIDTTLEKTQMTAHGANYGAFASENDNGMLYALYGLTGGYYGGWTVKPYYEVLNTYNNIENRDIWEINLNFTPDELDTMVAHLWEAGHSETRYYFFTKNCSYMIMELLDAVRPELKLADKFPVQAIPLDTFKAVYRKPGMVKGTNYRPSRQAKIIYRVGQMNPPQKKAFLAAIKRKDYSMAGVAEEQQSDVLETVYQYVQYQFVKKELSLAEYRRRSFMGLTVRSRLQDKPAQMDEKPLGKSPLEAHESMRWTVGAGSRNGESFQEIAYRPAYHSLTDNNYGLLPGAEINFLNFRVRHYDNRDKTVLEQLNLLGIKSIAPMNRMFFPTAFHVSVDIAREMRPDDDKEGYVANLKAGGGAAVEIADGVRLFGFGNTYGSGGGLLPNGQYVGIGAAGGVLIDFRYFKLWAEAEKIWATSWFGNKIKYKAEANIPLSTNWGFAAEYRYDDNQKGKNMEEFVVSLRHYF